MSMTPQNQSNSDGLLQSALHEWRLKDPLPPHFREQVWRRIELAEAQAPEELWSRFATWFGQALARPRMAAGYVTVLLLAGLLAGYWQARVEKTRTIESLSSRYVKMIDPYQARH
jgi:hypothetical protein